LILLASSNKSLLQGWGVGTFEFSPVGIAESYDLLKNKLVKNKPEILLLDYELPGMNGQKGIADLINLSREVKIIVFIPNLSDEVEWGLFRIGVRGCCWINTQPNRLKHVIEAIRNGELWIRRTLTNHMLRELVEVTQEKGRIERAVNELLVNLTRREYEIAMRVGQGESNKQIARQLDITERTVKAHLTEIFRKLRISDRIKLALIVKDTVSTLNPHS